MSCVRFADEIMLLLLQNSSNSSALAEVTSCQLNSPNETRISNIQQFDRNTQLSRAAC